MITKIISMKLYYRNCFCLPVLLLTFSQIVFGQITTSNSLNKIDTTKNYTTAVAGKEYKRSGFHQWLLGSNYRKEWVTPVRVAIINLDSTGGLTPYKSGGGHQTKSLMKS